MRSSKTRHSLAPPARVAEPRPAGSRAAREERRASRKLREARLGQWLPLLCVGIAVVFNLWVLRGELRPVQNLNDGAQHLAMIGWADHRIDTGATPLDGWFPYTGLGSPHFHQYQSTPHVITAYVSQAFGMQRTFVWSLYLLLSLWPLSVYWGARLLGWGRWSSAIAALASPLLVSRPGYGYEHGSYTWGGLGAWSQLWGMWVLPIAWGLSWRSVAKKGSYVLGALALAALIAFHFLTAYLAILAVGVWALLEPRELRRRLLRSAIIVGSALLISSWVIVPLIADSKWSVLSEYTTGTFWFDSYGAKQVLSWLFSGNLFDAGRLPVISLFVAIGVGVCVSRFRRDERARGLLGVFALSLLLFSGRPTLGPLLNILPGSKDLFLHRYIIGVHLSGLLLAGVGAAWLGRVLITQARRGLPRLDRLAATVAVVVVGLGWLSPAMAERARYDAQSARWVEQQRVADRSRDAKDLFALMNRAKAARDGRVYAGVRGNWGNEYKIGLVPVYAFLLTHRIDAIGFTLRTTGLSSDLEARFPLYESIPAAYDAFNVRYLILPAGRNPSVPATLIESRGRHTLWRVQTTGFFDVVDTTTPIIADRSNLSKKVDPFMRSDLLPRKLFPTIAFGGDSAATPTTKSGAQLSGAAGKIERSSVSLEDGRAIADVVANRRAVIMLKTSFHPRWKVFVDGVERKPQLIAPSFIAAPVSPGRHHLRFEYVSYPRYALLFLVGVLALLGLVFVPRLLARSRQDGAVE